MCFFYSLIFGLFSEEGHLYHYHSTVERAVSRIGWKYKAIVPKKTSFHSLPKTWIPLLILDRWDQPKRLIKRIRTIFGNFLPLKRFFHSIKNDDKSIVFLESFELQHVASLFLALCFISKPRFHFWILHRYHYREKKLKAFICRFFHSFLEWKLGKSHVKYLTDSELLADSQQLLFQRNIFLVPIPHTHSCKNEQRKNLHLYLWWPGSPRQDKGLEQIQNFTKYLSKYPRARLLLSEEAKEYLTENQQILFLPKHLSSHEYWKWMETADLILLPYSAQSYSHRTSGIFVEAICAGAIPITTKGSWMAYELKKQNLSALTFSWNEQNLIAQIFQVSEDLQVKAKLAQLRSHYQSFHSEKGFSKALIQVHQM